MTGEVEVWDLPSHRLRRVLRDPGWMPYRLAVAPDGRSVALAEMQSHPPSQRLAIWDLASGKSIRAIPIHGRLNAIAYSPDGSKLASAGEIVQLWHSETGTPLPVSFPQETSHAVTSIAFAPDGRTLVGGNWNGGSVYLWDAHDGRLRALLTHGAGDRSVYALAVSPDSRILAVSLTFSRMHQAANRPPGQIVFWDLARTTQIGSFATPANAVGPLVFRRDGRLLAGAAYEKVLVWDLSQVRAP